MRASVRAAFVAFSTPLEGCVDVEQVTQAKLAQDWGYLYKRFGGTLLDALPADAQLGLISLVWACGPAFRFPRFEAALIAQDFATCAVECQLDAAGNSGLVPRNRANRILFGNADVVRTMGGDPDELHYPTDLTKFRPAPTILTDDPPIFVNPDPSDDTKPPPEAA